MEAVEGNNPKKQLAYQLAESATSDVANAIRFLSDSSGGEEAAMRFAARLKQSLSTLCVRIAEEVATLGRTYDEPDESASLQFSRPVYRERLETNRSRSRRSSSGLWYIYYTLLDQNNTGIPGTIVVIRVRHSAARPFTLESEDDDK